MATLAALGQENSMKAKSLPSGLRTVRGRRGIGRGRGRFKGSDKRFKIDQERKRKLWRHFLIQRLMLKKIGTVLNPYINSVFKITV